MVESIKARLIRVACDISNQLRDVKEIDVPDVLTMESDTILFVDVRPDSERSVSMIPGAIASEDFEANPQVADGRTVIAYCTAGYRSGVFARKMARQQHEVVNLRGGLLSWCDQAQSLLDSNGNQTHRVHVYGRMWNLVEPPYEGVW